jgi:hypothetical protein
MRVEENSKRKKITMDIRYNVQNTYTEVIEEGEIQETQQLLEDKEKLHQTIHDLVMDGLLETFGGESKVIITDFSFTTNGLEDYVEPVSLDELM